MMIWAYRILFHPLLVILLPRYLLRMKRRGGYRKDFGTRFGSIPELPEKKAGVRRVWLQAVSVGEVFAAAPLLRALHADPSTEVFLTTTTSTGYALARDRYRDLLVGLAYFPLDFFPFSRRTWKRVRPDLCLLMESEIWPEHLHQAASRRVPLILINGRISDRSYRRLSVLPALTGRLLGKFTRILAASGEDADRFVQLGADRSIVETSGNIKLDVNLEPVLDGEQKRWLRHETGLYSAGAGDRKDSFPLLILGSSTWPGEEEALLRLLVRARDEAIDCQLLIVPRHMERREEIRKTLEAFPFTHHFRTGGPAKTPVDVAVADTTGELLRFTQLADLVFVGKSLSPRHRRNGGQTPIEAAAFGKTLLFGPYMTNFRSIARNLVDCDAAIVVGDDVDLADQALNLLKDESRRRELAANARRWHVANQGAVRRTLETVGKVLGAPPRQGDPGNANPDPAV